MLVTGKRETVESKEKERERDIQVHGQIINNDTGSQNRITTDINCAMALALLPSSTSHSIPSCRAFCNPIGESPKVLSLSLSLFLNLSVCVCVSLFIPSVEKGHSQTHIHTTHTWISQRVAHGQVLWLLLISPSWLLMMVIINIYWFCPPTFCTWFSFAAACVFDYSLFLMPIRIFFLFLSFSFSLSLSLALFGDTCTCKSISMTKQH